MLKNFFHLDFLIPDNLLIVPQKHKSLPTYLKK